MIYGKSGIQDLNLRPLGPQSPQKSCSIQLKSSNFIRSFIIGISLVKSRSLSIGSKELQYFCGFQVGA